MTKNKQVEIDVFDYITDRKATYLLGSAIRCMVVGSFGGESKSGSLTTAANYLYLCISKELEYVMYDTDNCDYSVVDLIKSYDLSTNVGCALINIDNALNFGMNFEFDNVRTQLEFAIKRLSEDASKITQVKGE